MKRRFLALLLAAAAVFLLAACGKGGDTFRYDIGARVTNLDPQFAAQQEAKLILANCMEGLLRQTGEGEIQPAAAEMVEVSPDGLTYTFTLRKGLTWSDGEPLTAHDFVFGFQRLFDREVPSPFVEDFLCIRNSGAILAGNFSADLLGVKAVDDRTLVITLEQANPFFRMALATPAAMPCRKDFFEETRGRYGLDKNALLCCGPFALTGWTDEKVTLVAREDYSGGKVLPEAVVFYIGREDPRQLLLEGKADAGAIEEELLQQAAEAGLNYTACDNAVWGLVFNQNREPFGDAQLRRALQMALDRSFVTGTLPENCPVTAAVIPPSIGLGDGRSYRETAGAVLDPVYTPEAGRTLLRGLLEEAEAEMPVLTLLLPEEEYCMACAGLIQQQWQQNLSVYLNLETLPAEEYARRLTDRDYDIALVEVRSPVNTPAGVLGRFMAASSENPAGYANPEFDRTVAQMAEAADVEKMVELAALAEDMLINDAVIYPLFLSTSYFATGESVRGLEYSPYSGQVWFQNATK